MKRERVTEIAEKVYASFCKGSGLFTRMGTFAIAGSLRRQKEDLHDLDIVVAVDPDSTAEVVSSWFLDQGKVLNKGLKHPAIEYEDAGESLKVECLITTSDAQGAAMLHATGNATFGKALRTMARSKGWKLNQYGLFSRATGVPVAPALSEGVLLHALGLPNFPPELREDDVAEEIYWRIGRAAPKEKAMPATQKQFSFVSRGSGQQYELTIHGDGVVSCSCPAWKFQQGVNPKARRCKHIKALESLPVGVEFVNGMEL